MAQKHHFRRLFACLSRNYPAECADIQSSLGAVPRIGAPRITDDTGTVFLNSEGDGQLAEWQAKVFEVARLNEQRGLGFAQVKALGVRLGALGDLRQTWFRALTAAADVHEERAVERAFSEWADGDTVASHVACGIDVFCTADKGNSNGAASILDPENRQWLADNYALRFMTIEKLADQVP